MKNFKDYYEIFTEEYSAGESTSIGIGGTIYQRIDDKMYEGIIRKIDRVEREVLVEFPDLGTHEWVSIYKIGSPYVDPVSGKRPVGQYSPKFKKDEYTKKREEERSKITGLNKGDVVTYETPFTDVKYIGVIKHLDIDDGIAVVGFPPQHDFKKRIVKTVPIANIYPYYGKEKPKGLGDFRRNS